MDATVELQFVETAVIRNFALHCLLFYKCSFWSLKIILAGLYSMSLHM